MKKIFITIASPFTKNIYDRLELDYLKKNYDIIIIDCVLIINPNFYDSFSIKDYKTIDLKIIKLSNFKDLAFHIIYYKPIFLLDSIGKSRITPLIQSVCRDNMLKYVYDAGINSISVSTFKNNFLELLVLFPRFFIKKIALLIGLIKNFNQYMQPDIVISSSIVGTIWDLSAKKRILTTNQFFLTAQEINYKYEIENAKKNDFILFLDDCLIHSFDYSLGHNKNEIDENMYFEKLDNFFCFIENKFKMPVYVAAHPNGLEYADYKSKFKNRRVFFDSSLNLSKDCFFAMTHHSLSIQFPILFYKPILILDLDGINYNIKKLQKNYCKYLGVERIKIEILTPKNDLNLKVNKMKYDLFIKKYLKSSNDKILNQYEPLVNYFKTNIK